MNLNDKKVLITGADGFIGSHLVELMHREGFSVRALSQYNSFNNWGWLEELDCLTDIDVVCGDIRDPVFTDEIIGDVDYIFHLAALIAIPYSYVAPHSYIETNINGTLNLLQSARKSKIKKFIHTSTSEIYGSAQYVPIDEKHPIQAQSPYSASKVGADALAYSYYSSFDLPVTIARPFNTYGPRQSARAIIPSVIIQLLSGAKQLNLGNLSPTRDFNYVTDTSNSLFEILKCNGTNGETINIGSGSEISIKDLVNLIQNTMNTNAVIIQDDERLRPENSEVERLCCDNKKIVEMTGFSPRISLEEGIRLTVEYLSRPECLKKYKHQIYNL